jgi:hypothetical protein
VELRLDGVPDRAVDSCDALAPYHVVTGLDGQPRDVHVHGFHTVPMVDLGPTPGPFSEPDSGDFSLGGSLNGHFVDVNVEPFVEPWRAHPVVTDRTEVRQTVPDHVPRCVAERTVNHPLGIQPGERAVELDPPDNYDGRTDHR